MNPSSSSSSTSTSISCSPPRSVHFSPSCVLIPDATTSSKSVFKVPSFLFRSASSSSSSNSSSRTRSVSPAKRSPPQPCLRQPGVPKPPSPVIPPTTTTTSSSQYHHKPRPSKANIAESLIPLNACCPTCIHTVDSYTSCLARGDEWEEKFSRGASKRWNCYRSAPPSEGCTGNLDNITVDEVDRKRRNTAEYDESASSSTSTLTPSSSSCPLASYRRPSARRTNSSPLRIPSRRPATLLPRTVSDDGSTVVCIVNDDDDDDQLFPLPGTRSPARSPVGLSPGFGRSGSGGSGSSSPSSLSQCHSAEEDNAEPSVLKGSLSRRSSTASAATVVPSESASSAVAIPTETRSPTLRETLRSNSTSSDSEDSHWSSSTSASSVSSNSHLSESYKTGSGTILALDPTLPDPDAMIPKFSFGSSSPSMTLAFPSRSTTSPPTSYSSSSSSSRHGRAASITIDTSMPTSKSEESPIARIWSRSRSRSRGESISSTPPPPASPTTGNRPEPRRSPSISLSFLRGMSGAGVGGAA